LAEPPTACRSVTARTYRTSITRYEYEILDAEGSMDDETVEPRAPWRSLRESMNELRRTTDG
jgi:hypothetical protein